MKSLMRKHQHPILSKSNKKTLSPQIHPMRKSLPKPKTKCVNWTTFVITGVLKNDCLKNRQNAQQNRNGVIFYQSSDQI